MQPFNRSCQVCGAEMIAKRNSKKFCSDTCKNKAYLLRNGFKNGSVKLSDTNLGHVSLPVRGVYSEPFIITLMNDSLDTAANKAFFIEHLQWGNLNRNNVLWVSIRLKCLLNQLLRLCYLQEVNHATFDALYHAFNAIIKSEQYAAIKFHYPYKILMNELQDRIKYFLGITAERSAIKFVMRLNNKAKILAAMREMGSRVPLKKYAEIDFA